MTFDKTCFKCNKTLDPLAGMETDFQFDNALWLGFFGGYGMFVESPRMARENSDEPTVIPGASFEAVLCHECAHEFMDTNPWLKRLFEPYSSHAHSSSYMARFSDHYGWDYDKRQEDLYVPAHNPWDEVSDD